jgi:hypothetical protein
MFKRPGGSSSRRAQYRAAGDHPSSRRCPERTHPVEVAAEHPAAPTKIAPEHLEEVGGAAQSWYQPAPKPEGTAWLKAAVGAPNLATMVSPAAKIARVAVTMNRFLPRGWPELPHTIADLKKRVLIGPA